MATSIDLNSDLGENVPDRIVSDDTAMLGIVSSANVSCGFHAGSPEGIRATVTTAVERGVAVGAHPGYDDYDGFGRRPVDVAPATLQAQVEYQIGALIGLATAVGGTVSYVKPHGALYNTIASDETQAKAVIAAVRAVAPHLVFLGLFGGVATGLAERLGLTAACEAFADRAYQSNGQLVPRTESGSVLDDADQVAARMVRLAQDGVMEAIDGSVMHIDAQSVCVHGDSEGSVAMAAATRTELESSGVRVAPFAGAAAA